MGISLFAWGFIVGVVAGPFAWTGAKWCYGKFTEHCFWVKKIAEIVFEKGTHICGCPSFLCVIFNTEEEFV